MWGKKTKEVPTVETLGFNGSECHASSSNKNKKLEQLYNIT